MPLSKKEKGQLIVIAIAGGLLGLLAYMLSRPAPSTTVKPACSMTKLSDGTTEILCRFPGDIGSDLMVDLMGARQIVSVSGNLVLTGIGQSGVTRPYNELRWNFTPFLIETRLSPIYYVECQNAAPGMVCNFQRVFPNIAAQKLFFRGMGSTAPFSNPITASRTASIVEPSSLRDFEIRIIVR